MQFRKTFALIVVSVSFSIASANTFSAKDRIDIYKANPAYWQYNGKPVLLLGGSVDDNLFQISGLKKHLDLLKSVGGNYVRCTMSGRDKGNVWPFKKVKGKYDLNQWEVKYWKRFENFLKLTSERDIIVQIELWATFDYYGDNWQRNPFNPKNNINYTAKQTWLAEEIPSHPIRCENNFFWTVPKLRWLTPKGKNQQIVFDYQKRFIDKMLSCSLKYDNILYCMDNETSTRPKWGWYWSRHIKKKANEAGVKVHTTEMWDPHDLEHPFHAATFDYPEIYSFIDVSQNNHQKNQAHWDNAQRQRKRIADKIRPLNNVKIYGIDTGLFGSTRNGIERFWRNIFGGMASARFHRPGLGKKARTCIKSLRTLTDKMNVFTCKPHNDLLSERDDDEAYCFANPGKEYAVFFTNGGEVKLDISALKGQATVQWLDIMKSEWKEAKQIKTKSELTLQCPAKGYWAILVQ